MSEENNQPNLERVPPQNIDAERAVLGAMLMPKEGNIAISKVIQLGLRPAHFYREAHQIFYATILSLHEKGQAVDLLTLTKSLTERGFLNEIYGVPYLDEMIESVPTAENIEYYAQIVMEAADRREIIARTVELYQKAQDESVSIEDIHEDIQLFASTRLLKQNGLFSEQPLSDDIFIAQERQKTPMFVGMGILPRVGYSMISAPTKVGKTTLVVQMCHSIISNTAFLGVPIESQASVLYCFLEGDEYGTQELMKQQRENWGQTWKSDYHIFPEHCYDLNLQNVSHVAQLRQRIKDTNAGLCVLDPLSRCVHGDINRREVVARYVSLLAKLSKELAISFLLVHHEGKKTMVDRESIEKALGSVEWGNAAESHIGIGRWSQHRSPEYLRLVFKLRRGTPLDDVCVYRNPHTRLFELVADPDEIPAMSIDRVVDILREHGQPISYSLLTEIVKANLRVSERTAKRLIQAARESGKVVKEDGRLGKYFLF